MDPGIALIACTAVSAVALALGVVNASRGLPKQLRDAYLTADEARTTSQATAAKVDGLIESIEIERDAIRRGRARLSAAESRSAKREGPEGGPPGEGASRASLVDHYRRASGLARGTWANGEEG